MAASNSPAPNAAGKAVQLTRLTKRSQFLELKDSGRRVQTPAFVCQYLIKEGQTASATGFTASSKGVGNAVHRNRARRRLKAALAQCLRGQTITPGLHLAFIAKQNIFEIKYKYLLKDMQKALEQSGLLNTHEKTE